MKLGGALAWNGGADTGDCCGIGKGFIPFGIEFKGEAEGGNGGRGAPLGGKGGRKGGAPF